MRTSAGELARLIGGRIEGDPDRPVTGVAPLERAGPGDLSFVTNLRYTRLAAETKAGVLLVPVAGEWAQGGRTCIRHENPYLALARLLTWAFPEAPAAPGIEPTCAVGAGTQVGRDPSFAAHVSVGRGCALGDRVRLDAGVVLGDGVRIGDDTRIFPNVVVYAGVTIGRRVRIHSGTVVGSDGFGYARDGAVYVKIPQLGGVVIGDDVEIGSNVSIDRGTLGDTVVGAGAKIDNLVQIAHNVEIGPNTVIAAMAGISGSARIGAGVTFAGQSGTVGHVRVGDGTIVTAKSGVTKDTAPGSMISGWPGVEHRRWLRTQAAAGKLTEIPGRVARLEHHVRELLDRMEKNKT